MSAESIILDTFGRPLSADEMRAVVFLVSKASAGGRGTDVDAMSYWDCVKWMDDNEDLVRGRLKKIVGVGGDGRLYGDCDAVCSFAEYAYVKSV